MHPDTFYTVTAKYYDVDGRDDLNICYLRLNYPSRRLTMMWYQVDGNYDCYAGDEGKSYLTISDVHPTEIPGSPEGYELAWTFKINDSWPEVENAIDFGVFASDDSGLDSGDWHYDDTNASFILEKTGTVTGRVTDASTGQGIDGVTLLLNPDPFIYSPGTSGGGYFSFSLPEGTYSITASASGYSSVAKSVTVTAGRPTEVDFALSKQERVPVIIIPGVPGSELLCNGDLIFPDLPTLALDYLPWVNRLLDCLKLAPDGVSPAHPQYDITVGNDIVRSLVETRIRVLVPSNPYTTLGGLLVDSKWEEKVIFGHDYFNGLINYLKGVGYREGSIYNATPGDLYVFPYDWRLDLRFSALRLGNAIKWVLENSNTTEVDIIAHSTG
ncbi:MAG: PEGA domain-containing protein, partial [Dehalococcoidia bacterium]